MSRSTSPNPARDRAASIKRLKEVVAQRKQDGQRTPTGRTATPAAGEQDTSGRKRAPWETR
jgi:hypothetical protein